MDSIIGQNESVNKEHAINEKGKNEGVCNDRNEIRKIKIMYSNVDTLNKDKLIELGSRLGQEKPDIIMLQKVKPKYYKRKLQAIEYHIQGYEMIQKNVESDTGRGLCTYIKSGFEYREVKYETQFDEYIAVEIKDKDDELYVFVNIYRSPNSR